ncbi:MAG: nitrilase-related carbon-nitrogen hydrolase [Actinoallomurus sp.]
MGDRLGVVRAAVVQAAAVFLDREKTVDKTVALIEEAGRMGAQVAVFPEGFIPTHPLWLHFHAATSRPALDMAAELFRNSVVVGGPETDRIAQAAHRAGVWTVLGVCEKRAETTGTMWNSAVHFSPEGRIAAVHRKLTPTLGERLVHTGGDGEGLRVPRAPFGPVSSLICAENSNPLLTFSASAQYAVLHAALWPNHFSPTQPPMRDVIVNSSRAIAYQGACYVLNAAGTLAPDAVPRIGNTPDDIAWLEEGRNLGGSCIVAPSGEIVAGPAGSEETILVADLDLDLLVGKRVIHDYAGHYNRSDLLTLSIEPSPRPLFQPPWLRGDDDRDIGGGAAPVTDTSDDRPRSETLSTSGTDKS